jgi:hypothetical protein
MRGVGSTHDFISDYLDSLPPDERRVQARSFEESALLRLAVERVLELEPEDQKVLMAEFEVYADTGEVEEGSLFAELLEDADAEEWGEARARSKAAGGRSPLLRFLSRAGYEESMREFEDGFSQVDPLEQAFLKLVFDLAAEIGLLRREGGAEFVDRVADEGPHAMPMPDGSKSIPHETLVVISVCGAIQRLEGEMRDETMYVAARRHREFAEDARHLRDKLPWGWWYDSSRARQTAALIVELFELDDELTYRVEQLVEAWQRLTWVSECIERQGVYLGGRAETISRQNGGELLLTIAESLDPLLQVPELLRELPLNPNSYLYPRHANKRLLKSMRIRAEPELARAFIQDIRERRHYVLDHIARVELGGRYGIERIVFGPERWHDDFGVVGYIVHHKRGAFLGTTMIAPGGVEELGWPALSRVPVFNRELDGEPVEELANLFGHFTILALAAWRNIVVPRVRDEHYDVTVRRKPKGSGKRTARQARRGDLAIVEYLPRLLAIRREEEAERKARGESAPLRRVYRVGTFTKTLPEGQKRSPEAEAFAKRIGIPLADWQTIVHPHWRGGTPEEREAAEAATDVPVKEWRSWDALDLLNARSSI